MQQKKAGDKRNWQVEKDANISADETKQKKNIDARTHVEVIKEEIEEVKGKGAIDVEERKKKEKKL